MRCFTGDLLRIAGTASLNSPSLDSSRHRRLVPIRDSVGVLIINVWRNTVDMKTLIICVTAVAATSSSFAQQTEFVAPDAQFRPALTRAEVRADFATAYTAGNIAQRRYDGKDTVYLVGPRTRQDVRTDRSPKRAGNVNDLYFGA